MITLEIIQRIWSLIPPPTPDGSIQIHELDISPDENAKAILTIDHQGHRHLLLPATSNRKLIEDKKSSGLHLLSSEWVDEQIRRLFVDLVCLKPHLNGLFDLIIYDVLTEIEKFHVQPDRACLTILDKWREFLSRDAVTPEPSAVIGLFGELTILRRLVQINAHSLPLWMGPDGGRFDFFAGNHALEVKTTTRRQGIQLTIHGHDQLDAPVKSSLYLAVILIEETPGAGENLSMLVEALVALGVNRADTYRKLARIGFTTDILEMLNGQRFTLVEQRVYPVDDSFPRITAGSFITGQLPRGVIALNYTIDLSVPPPYPLNETDAAAVITAMAESVS